MGHRANYVLIQNGTATAFYDQWRAMGCIYAFAGGPNEAAAVASAAQPTTELLDWAFAEGGFLLDFDEKRAIIFGMPGEPMDPADLAELCDVDPAEVQQADPLGQTLEAGPEEYLRSITLQWAGWSLSWDDRGVDSFAAHLSRRQIAGIVAQPPSASAAAFAVEIQA